MVDITGQGVAIIVEHTISGDAVCVLLGKRLSKYGYGLWGLPGGKVDPGEDVFEAALRELGEETAIEATRLQLILVGLVFEHRMDTGGQQLFQHTIFRYHLPDQAGQPIITNTEPQSCQGWVWHPVDQLPDASLIVPGHRAGLAIHSHPNSLIRYI